MDDGETTILVVGDDAGIRQLIVATLRRSRYTFLEGRNGRETPAGGTAALDGAGAVIALPCRGRFELRWSQGS